MKKLSILTLVISMLFSLESSAYENKLLGFKFDLPANWDSVGVLDVNKPASVYEAIRAKSTDEFLTLVVYPTKEQAVNKEGLTTWQTAIERAFGANFDKSKDVEIQDFSSGSWYSIVISLKSGDKVFLHNIIKNGYNYILSFLNNKTNQKQFKSEITELLNSFSFDTPESIALVKSYFRTAIKDLDRNVFIPDNFYLTTSINRNEVCPYAYDLYSNLLADRNTDCVLVSKDYFNQLFCLNIKFDMTTVDEMTVNLISNMAGNKIKQEGNAYEALFIGPWKESPNRVFLHKYRFIKNRDETTVYIFYCSDKENKTDIIKVQLATPLEQTFEEDIYGLVLKNL